MKARPYPPERDALLRIQVKLDRWELVHLREHAQDLAARLEDAESRLDAAEERVSNAEAMADHWREQLHQLHAELAADLALGMTHDGSLHIVDRTGSPS